ncbi:hypothetical protein TSUD_418790, partial [Trifolium subterraneum]
FSLDVTGETVAEDPLLEPVTPVEPKTLAIEHEPTLESGWLRGNCKFRSPVLQLHIGYGNKCYTRYMMQAEPAFALGLIRAGALQNATSTVPGAAQSYSVVDNCKIRLRGDSNVILMHPLHHI